MKALEPAPEEPLELGNDEKRDEDRAHEDTDGRGDESVGDYDDGDGLGRGQQDDDDDIDGCSENVAEAGESMRASKSAILCSTVCKFASD